MRFDEGAVVDAILVGGKGGLKVVILLKHRKEVQLFINNDHAVDVRKYSFGRGALVTQYWTETYEYLSHECFAFPRLQIASLQP